MPKPVAKQSSSLILTIEPKHFHANPATRESNHFQKKDPTSPEALKGLGARAKLQHRGFRATIAQKGANVLALKGESEYPDGLFLNNWFSTHGDQKIAVIYPLQSEARRGERREDIIKLLHGQFTEVWDMSDFEKEGKFLEGTGSLVLDRVNKIAYAARSARTDEGLVNIWAQKMGYTPIVFDTLGKDGFPIYHTNVMMFVGTSIAGICLESIPKEQRGGVVASFEKSGHEILDLSLEQIEKFAGNALEIDGGDKGLGLMVSNTGYKSLTDTQKEQLHRHYNSLQIGHPKFSGPQAGGGSVRCAMAEIFPEKGIHTFREAFNGLPGNVRRETTLL